MTLTTRFHTSSEVNSQWHEIESNDSRYKMYEEALSNCERVKIIAGIVIKSIFTFGIYYCIYLKCTKDGQKDLENLKKRRLVHYVTNETSNANAITEKTKRTGYPLLSGKDFDKQTELIERNRLKESLNESDKRISLTDFFKSYINQIQDFRSICGNIKDIILTKRAYFLDQLYKEDLCIEDKKLSIELEKFLRLDIEKQDSYNLIRLLVPFLKEKDLTQLLRNAIESAKNTQEEIKTIYHEKFEEFQTNYSNLSSKTDWLISIREKVDLFNFAQELLELGEDYSPQFISLYDNSREFFNQCLESMQEKFQIDPQIKLNLNESFQKWKNTVNDLQKNLAPSLSEKAYGIHYTLNEHLQNKFEALGFNEEFQAAVALNEIDIYFIKLFFSERTNTVWQSIDSLIQDSKMKEQALLECQRKIDKAKQDDEDAAKKIENPETIEAFKKLKEFFIDTPDYNDAVYTLVELELLMLADLPDWIDPQFFNFIRKLKESDFFIKDKAAQRDKEFYLEFKDDFYSLDRFIAIIKRIVKRTAQ